MDSSIWPVELQVSCVGAELIIISLSGCLGGIANVYAGQPLDTIKVKLQTFPHLYSSSVKCFRDTFVADGIRGLYAGK